jgi:glycosyltransferase involved in cell wall biosynthesis
VTAGVDLVYVIDSLAGGGAETSLAAVAPSLVGHGVQLHVVSLKPVLGVQEALRDAGATVTELQGSRRTWWRQLHRVLEEQRPSLVHTTLFEADVAGRIAARLSRLPVVSTLANDSYGAPHRAEYAGRLFRLRAAHLADALTARLAVRLHAISNHVADVMAARLRYPRERIDVIPRARDAAVLGLRTEHRRRCARQRLGVSADEYMVLTVARQEHQKGLDVLVGAAAGVLAEFSRARVVVAGRAGNATPSLRREHATIEGSERIEFLGPRTDVADLLCAADLFVFPSRREGFGSSLLEAMALECPIIASDLPPIREVVGENCAVLVPPEDADALRAAIVSTLSRVDEAQRRATRARQRYLERFTVEAVADQMVCFYERAIDHRER